jgi:hypothetical protein
METRDSIRLMDQYFIPEHAKATYDCWTKGSADPMDAWERQYTMYTKHAKGLSPNASDDWAVCIDWSLIFLSMGRAYGVSYSNWIND